MSKSKFSTILRTALWRANKCKCFYCEEHITFVDLWVDHLIPERTMHSRINYYIQHLNLPATFTINSPLNLVPSHHGCNRRKSDQIYSDANLRFYFECWAAKQLLISHELDRLRQKASIDKLLTNVAAQIEAGHITREEVIHYLPENTLPQLSSEPIVISFGVSAEELLGYSKSVESKNLNYIELCDKLESHLAGIIHQTVSSLSVETEPSCRDGETLTLRYAFWNIDIEVFYDIDIYPWVILEIAPFSEIYDSDWDEFFPRAIVQTYHSILRTQDICPRCGSNKISHKCYPDPHRDELWHVSECQECGWLDAEY